MNMKLIAGGTITLSTLALAAGLTLFFLSLMPVLALGLMIVAGGLFTALVLIISIKAIIDRNRPILEKAIAARVVDEDGIPIVKVIDEKDVKLSGEQIALLADIKNLPLRKLHAAVDEEIDTAKKIQPCDVMNNLKIAYPLGAQNGVATRALDETVADEAFNQKWSKSLGVNGYVCQVAKVWALFTCVYNHIDDLKNTKGYSDYTLLCRMANVIGYLVLLKAEIKRAQELRPKLSVEAWEALSLKASPPIIKRQRAQQVSYIDYDEAQLKTWAGGLTLKKAPQAEGIAEEVQVLAARA